MNGSIASNANRTFQVSTQMRELPMTVALSVLAHAAALSWFVSRDHSDGAPLVARPAPAVENPTLEVAFLAETAVTQLPESALDELLSPAPPRSTPPRDQRRENPSAPAIATTTTTPTELPAPATEPPAAPPKGRSLLSMRHGPPEPRIHRPGSDGISDEELEQMTNGTLPVKIANLPGARENADLDRAQARLRSQNWVTNATPDQLTAARIDRAAARQATKDVELVAQKDGTHRSEKTTFIATTNRDGTVDLSDKKNWQQKSLFHAEIDITDAFMRRHGQDPYASEKREFLDRTRDQRVEIGKRYRAEQLAQSAQLMAVNLGRLWATTQDPAKRKEELFALWDECAETGDPKLVAGGIEARRLLVNWMRVKRVELTPAELETFNARRQSTETFAP